MNAIKDLVRLIITEPHLTERQIAARTGVSKGSVNRYRALIRASGVTWEQIEPLSGSAVFALFNTPRPSTKVVPDYDRISEELKTPGVTVWLLWKEYRREHGVRGLSYSRFADLCRRHADRHHPVMRQTHPPGDIVFVDFSAVKPAFQSTDGKVHSMELFVAVLGCSRYVFACCVPTQSEVDWIDAHARMWAHLGGTPNQVVPDNLKAGVDTPRRRLALNPRYLAFLEHYGVACIPARPRRPTDKGLVENGVRICEREIVAPLRHRVFPTLADLNEAVAACVEEINGRPFQHFPDSRRDRFRTQELPALRPLPETPHESGIWLNRQRVPMDYHVRVLDHFYSVPHTLTGQMVGARVTPDWIEVYFNRDRVARHKRNAVRGGTTTDPAHQPPHHRAHAERNQEGFLIWAKAIGPATLRLMEAQFDRRVPLQGLADCDALKALAYRHGDTALERAAADALTLSVTTVSGVERCLPTGSSKTGPACSPPSVPLAQPQ